MKLNKMIKSCIQKNTCNHENVIEMTTFGDSERRFKCRDCGEILKREY
jgi:transposase-like protein